MLISLQNPPKGRRIQICRADEAVVRRIISLDKYNGMCERIQKVSALPFHFLIVRTDDFEGTASIRISPMEAVYHLLKFLSARFARAMFPDNFVNMHELRFFRKRDGLYAATYSDFVPDETGVIKRRHAAMQRFYQAKTKNESDEVIRKTDSQERISNPAIVELAECIGRVGIGIPHPEANYHVSDGKTVFFEVCSLHMDQAIEACARYETALLELATLHTLYIKRTAYLWLRFEGVMARAGQDFVAMPVAELFNIVYHSFLSSKLRGLILNVPEALKSRASFWRFLMEAWGNPTKPLPYEIDQAVFDLFGSHQ